jgi:hypothetical protein
MGWRFTVNRQALKRWWRRFDGLDGAAASGVGGAIFLLLALGRAWQHLFGQPYLYMEQATVYYKYAFEHDWLESLFAPHQGYLNFWINFITTAAAKWLPMAPMP